MSKYAPNLKFKKAPKWATLIFYVLYFALVYGVLSRVLPSWPGVMVTDNGPKLFMLTFFLTWICPSITALVLMIANIVLIVRNPQIAGHTTGVHTFVGVAASVLTVPCGLLFVSQNLPDLVKFMSVQTFVQTAFILAGLSLLIFFGEQVIATDLARK